MKKKILEFRHVSKVYPGVNALSDVSLDLYEGEVLALMGENGAGKSTLMNIIGALDVPTKGEYYLGGEDVSKMEDKQLARIRNKMIGFIFQQYNLLPKLNLLENVELPLIYRGIDRKTRRNLAIESLKMVGLEKRLHHKPNEMSGGQQQRVAIARAIAAKPPVILADEPTGNLDSSSSREILGILKDMHKTGKTIILITHDNGIADQAKRVVRIMDGKIESDTMNEKFGEMQA